MSAQQCWGSMCLLEETIRHSFSKLTQACWLPQIAFFIEAYELSTNNYFNCILTQLHPKLQSDQIPDDILLSSMIRTISMALTFVKALRNLPQPSRTALYSQLDVVDNRCG